MSMNQVSILIVCVCVIVNGYKQDYTPHIHKSDLSIPVPSLNNGKILHNLKQQIVHVGDPATTLIVNTTSVTRDNSWIKVKWDGTRYQTPNDWIGIFPCLDDNCEAASFGHAPVQFKLLSDGKSIPPTSGEVEFLLQLRPGLSSYRAAYIVGDIQFPQSKAVTEKISFVKVDALRPLHLRLSLVASDDSAMRVMWAQHKIDCSNPPMVRYGEYSKRLTLSASVKGLFELSSSDMCDADVEPAATSGWIPSGTQIEAILSNLKQDTVYYYQVGDDTNGWSVIESFKTPKTQDSMNFKPSKIVAFGDMGQSNNALDESLQHSPSSHGHGQRHAPCTTHRVKKLVEEDDVSLVLHFGDISYAMGYQSEWDTFMSQIESVATKVPWMTAIGNHELLWSKSFLPGVDSGGECGMPYLSRFPFATFDYPNGKTFDNICDSKGNVNSKTWTNGNWMDKPWYSFNYEGVHYVVMSSEHDYAPDSIQYKFLENDLKAIDRSVTPWTVFTGHRPMYISSDYGGDQDTALLLRKYIEPLLIEYHVDVAFWGHHHSYQRTCPMAHGQCVLPGQGPVHLVVGTAGYDHSPVAKHDDDLFFEKLDDKTWGIASLTFHNTSVLEVSYHQDTTGDVLDRVYVMNREV